MGKGVLWKANTSAWSKTICKKFTTTTMSDGKIRHADTSNWYDNYPMEQSYTETFNATWSQGYNGSGTPLDAGVWQGNIITGSTTNYKGMFGFNQSAIQNFISGGTVTQLKLLINCYETTANGSPDVTIGKHSYSSKPSGSWNGSTNADWGDFSSLHVPNQALGGYWVTLKPTQATLANMTTAIGGIALRGATATNEDMGKFNGVSSFTTQLQITVLK
jgi:hypothetical protein